MSVTAEEVKGMLDVALLTPTTTPTEVEAVALIVRNEGYGQMCVNTAHIQRAAAALKGSRVKVVAPVGFPLGARPNIESSSPRLVFICSLAKPAFTRSR